MKVTLSIDLNILSAAEREALLLLLAKSRYPSPEDAMYLHGMLKADKVMTIKELYDSAIHDATDWDTLLPDIKTLLTKRFNDLVETLIGKDSAWLQYTGTNLRGMPLYKFVKA